VLRTDNGGELCGKEFDHLCKKCGIAHQNATHIPHNKMDLLRE
jgi:hypothetical protein